MAHQEQSAGTHGLRDAVVRSVRSFYALLGNRRKFERSPFAGTVVLRVSSRVVERTERCSCVNISPRGIGVDCSDSIFVDSMVELLSDGHGSSRMARVRYCRPNGDGYRIGLEFFTDPKASK